MMRSCKLGVLIGAFLGISALVSAQAAETQFSEADQKRVMLLEQALPERASLVERIDLISAGFLGVPYRANTLVGNAQTPEKLVIRLDTVDCYTFVDLVRALTFSHDEKSFVERLIQTRYREGVVAFDHRRHFLSDWWAVSPRNAIDITSTLSPHAETMTKTLNLKADGSHYIDGLPTTPRAIAFLSPNLLTQDVITKIHTGDVIGIYTQLPGLDVTHTGFAIWRDHVLYFRNASSLKRNMRVIDIPLLDYIRGKPGITVMRLTEYRK